MAVFRLSPASILRRFRSNQKGAAAVEFAFVAVPFFALMCAIVEVALSFFLTQILETATADAARLVMTGQVQAVSMTQGQFRQQVCNRLPSLFDCSLGSVIIDVAEAANFSAADVSRMTEADMAAVPRYQPGVGGSIVIVRVAYKMPVWANFYGASLATTSDGKMILMATSAFRNEPFLAGGLAPS